MPKFSVRIPTSCTLSIAIEADDAASARAAALEVEIDLRAFHLNKDDFKDPALIEVEDFKTHDLNWNEPHFMRLDNIKVEMR